LLNLSRKKSQESRVKTSTNCDRFWSHWL